MLLQRQQRESAVLSPLKLKQRCFLVTESKTDSNKLFDSIASPEISRKNNAGTSRYSVKMSINSNKTTVYQGIVENMTYCEVFFRHHPEPSFTFNNFLTSILDNKIFRLWTS